MIEKMLRDKIVDLRTRAALLLAVQTETRKTPWLASADTWITEALHASEVAVPDVLNVYRQNIRQAAYFGDYDRLLIDYAFRMGVDPRFIAMASGSRPKDRDLPKMKLEDALGLWR